jgi:hypothetical protein
MLAMLAGVRASSSCRNDLLFLLNNNYTTVAKPGIRGGAGWHRPHPHDLQWLFRV